MNLKGKITLITGATAGIGKACAEVFAEAGSDLVLIARRQELLNQISSDLAGKYGVSIISRVCDIRQNAELEYVWDRLPYEMRAIDVLINNAGLASGLSKIFDGAMSDWEQMIDTNIKGLLYVSRLVLPGMVERNSGIVINIASIAGRQVYPNGNVYCGTKAAVKAISEGMVIDLNGTNVRVCNIDPGLVETEFAKVRFHGDDEKAAKVYEGYKPLEGRDVAEIALFAATRPRHVMIQDILVTPTDQATTMIINKK